MKGGRQLPTERSDQNKAEQTVELRCVYRRFVMLTAVATPLVALAVLQASCGMLGADDSVPTPKLDPASGFVDQSAVQLCFDGKLVVSSTHTSNGPMAFCLASGVTAALCEDDAACGQGEHCLCGRCVTRACRVGTDCDAGQVCHNNRCVASCSPETPCEGGHPCVSGGCSRPCNGDNDCAYGEVCSSFERVCVVKLCGKSTGCASSEVCVDQEWTADIREPHLMNPDAATAQGGSSTKPAANVAYLELATGKSCAIYRAVLQTDRRWQVDPIAPVLEPGQDDNECLGAPSVVMHDGRYIMAAARGDGSAIVSAHSSDGVAFVREQAPLLTPSVPWENNWVGAPSVATWRDKFVLVYEGGRGSGIGLAVVEPDGAHRVSDAPWLVAQHFVDPVYWRSVSKVSSPAAFARNDALLVYLTVRGVEGVDATTSLGDVYPADENDSIGLASTTDLLNLEVFPAGPVFARKTNMRAYLGESEPCVAYSPKGSKMVYVRGDASGKLRMGLGLAATHRP